MLKCNAERERFCGSSGFHEPGLGGQSQWVLPPSVAFGLLYSLQKPANCCHLVLVGHQVLRGGVACADSLLGTDEPGGPGGGQVCGHWLAVHRGGTHC